MESNEILEGNKLIAEFMGLQKAFAHEKDEHNYTQTVDGFIVSEFEQPIPVSKLKYHSSWDWLMPVVEKIEKFELMECQAYVQISPFDISLYCSGHLERGLSELSYQLHGRKFEGVDKIEAVYQCAIEYIKWYTSA